MATCQEHGWAVMRQCDARVSGFRITRTSKPDRLGGPRAAPKSPAETYDTQERERSPISALAVAKAGSTSELLCGEPLAEEALFL